MYVSFDMNFIRHGQKMRRNGEAELRHSGFSGHIK